MQVNTDELRSRHKFFLWLEICESVHVHRKFEKPSESNGPSILQVQEEIWFFSQIMPIEESKRVFAIHFWHIYWLIS